MRLKLRNSCGDGMPGSCGKQGMARNEPFWNSPGRSNQGKNRGNLGLLHNRRVNLPAVLFMTALWLLVALAGPAPMSQAQSLNQFSRVVQGKVLDHADNPQPHAVVYLQNQKTLDVKTYITIADGSYRFGQLSNDVDYQLWAKYKELKSKTKSISSFDSKKQFTFDLKLEASK